MSHVAPADLAEDLGWDDEVDLICIGPDSAAAVFAVAADAAGRDVLLVAGTGRPDADNLADRLGLTGESADYLTAVTGGIAVLADPAAVATPIARAPGESDCPELPGSVTFSGAALRDWAAQCLSSPVGMLHTAAAAADCKPLLVGSVDGADDWLSEGVAAVRDEPTPVLSELLLRDGQAVGAVVRTDAGVSRIHAVDGVVIAVRPDGPLPLWRADAGATDLMVVTRPFSRFARLEFR